MVFQVIIGRLHKIKLGRKSTKRIITTDWQELDSIATSNVLYFLNLTLPTKKELQDLKIDIISLIKIGSGKNVKALGDVRPNKRVRYLPRKKKI